LNLKYLKELMTYTHFFELKASLYNYAYEILQPAKTNSYIFSMRVCFSLNTVLACLQFYPVLGSSICQNRKFRD